MRIAALKFSSMFTKLVWAALLMSALLLSACGGKDKRAKTPKGQVALSASVLEFEVPPARTVSEEEAEQALLAFGLGEDAKDVKRTGKGGNYIYTNITLESDEFSMGSFEITGLHMLGDIPMFDGIIFRDVTTFDEDNGVKSSFDEVTFIGPTPMLCQMIADGIEAEKVSGEDEDIAAYFKATIANLDALDLSAEDRKARLVIGFDQFTMAGVSAVGDGLKITVGSMVIGRTKDGTGAGQLRDLNITMVDSIDDVLVVLKLGLYEITDFNLEKFSMFADPDFYVRVQSGDSEEELMGVLKSYIDPFNPHFAGYLVKDFSFAMDESFSIDMSQASLVSTRKGDVLTRVTRVSPITIMWPEHVADQDLQGVLDVYASMGYDKVVVSGGATTTLNETKDTIDVSNYHVQFDDMFRVSSDIKMGGVKTGLNKFVDVMGAEGFDTKTDDEVAVTLFRMLGSELKTFELTLTFTDLSIIEQSLKLGAKKLTDEDVGEFTPEMMNAKAKASVSMFPLLAQDDAQLEYLTDVSEAMTSLIDNSGSITFSMKPKMPIDFEAIQAGVAAGEFDISVLGLEVSAQPPKH